jgi:pimeloyl-ACP methyl ester carboxylesterase
MKIRIVLFVLSLSITCLAQLTMAQTAPANASHGFAPVSGGKLYYEVAGQGHALVLIHGGQLDNRMWDDQFQFFAQKYKVIRYDVRGFGSSPAATQPFSSKDDLEELLKHLKIDKAYVVGLSLGGRIAIDFAIAHPDMVDALVLAGPGLSGFDLPPDPLEIQILQAAQNGDAEKAADLWLKSAYMAPAMKNPQLAPRLRKLALDNAKENLDNPILEKDIFAQSEDHLPEIKANTLVIIGSLDVKGIHEIAGLLRARILNSADTVIQGAGHMLNMERPQEFNSIVLGFLEKQPPIKMERR